MGAAHGDLFCDEDLTTMYDQEHGRPSLLPSPMAGVVLIQFHDHVSDEEAVQRLRAATP
jgi:hypothetical protein